MLRKGMVGHQQQRDESADFNKRMFGTSNPNNDSELNSESRELTVVSQEEDRDHSGCKRVAKATQKQLSFDQRL